MCLIEIIFSNHKELDFKMPKNNKRLPSLGEYLKDERLKAKLTQREVSNKLGYFNEQIISDWEEVKYQ